MTTDGVHLEGLEIGGYRSFGLPQRIGPLRKVNFFAGQNNSGKSNILRYVDGPLARLAKLQPGSNISLKMDELDAHRPRALQMSSALAFTPGGNIDSSVREHNVMNPTVVAAWASLVKSLTEEGMVWIPFFLARNNDQLTLVFSKEWTEGALGRTSAPDWGRFADLVGTQQRDKIQNVEIVVRWIIKEVAPSVRSVLIPAVREVSNDSAGDGDYSGRDLIHRLDQLQSPTATAYAEDSMRFDRINDFLASVTDTPDAAISIPHNRSTINVRLGGRLLPLENLGSGIHEVVMLAAWATIFENQIVCIEEPELHLHPLLQRKLIRYLAEETSNQYMIATHSAHLLDFPDGAVFHVRHDGEQSTVTRGETTESRVDLCADLGYLATDLLQANAVVWVEGPTDRLYIRHWLRERDPDLIEGIHFALMFYGGRLLNHLSAGDQEVDNFISLRRINQWMAIVIDSDRSKKGQGLNATKRRVRDQLESGRGLAWVTKGREIENYIPFEAYAAAVAGAHPNARQVTAPVDEFSDITKMRIRGKTNRIDKVKVARAITAEQAEQADLNVLDLRRQVNRLSTFIRQANGMDPLPSRSS